LDVVAAHSCQVAVAKPFEQEPPQLFDVSVTVALIVSPFEPAKPHEKEIAVEVETSFHELTPI
jgi:hypothetical protein